MGLLKAGVLHARALHEDRNPWHCASQLVFVLLLSHSSILQVSDWGMRPLTTEQKQYASSDAHVLTALADKILSASGQVQIFTRSIVKQSTCLDRADHLEQKLAAFL